MYRSTVAWRAQYSVPSIMATHGAGELYAEDGSRMGCGTDWRWQRSSSSSEHAALAERYGFWGRLERPASADGAPLAVWRIGAADVAGYVREGLVDVMERAFAAHLEDLLQCGRAASMRGGTLVRCRMIIDAHGMGLGTLRHRETMKRIMSLGKAYFPEVNVSVTIIRAPRVFARIYSVAKPLLTPTMQRKVCILGDNFENGLREHASIEKSALPAYLGGEARDDEVCATAFVPRGLEWSKA